MILKMVCYIHFGYENLNGGVYFVQFDDLDIAKLNLALSPPGGGAIRSPVAILF